MLFFLDTAKIDEVKEAAEMGILAGVTTNPSLVAKAGGDFKNIVKQICAIVEGPISLEVVAKNAKDLVKEARNLAKQAPNIVIKIPMGKEGIKAVTQLAAEGISTNVTLVFSVSQALLAANAGATYVSPFVGRIDDISWEGMDVVRDIVAVLDYYQFPTQVIAASIRHPLHVAEAAKAGAHIATVPFEVLEKLFDHPLTDIGVERFNKDWDKVKKK
ncbi:MAG: fructose-6-phosphate aldolase [Chloroflexi bacterium]|nr:fructose-6-phosphate aldolase [Chloroflexota bacterium]